MELLGFEVDAKNVDEEQQQQKDKYNSNISIDNVIL